MIRPSAADTIRADVGVRDGRVVVLAERVEGAAKQIDASGLLVLPGGFDSHIHRFVELTATNHAKIYGLYRRKG